MEKKISVKDLLRQAFLTGGELSDKIIAQDGKTGKHDTVWLNREVMGL